MLRVISLLPRKSKKMFSEPQRAYSSFAVALLRRTDPTRLIRLVLIVFLFTRSVFAAKPAPLPSPGEPNLIERSCELIYQGKFDAAGELIKSRQVGSEDTQSRSPSLAGLAKIVEESRSISQRRQSAREAAYREQLAELEKFRAKIDVNDIKDANNRSDVNDVNNIAAVLSVITKACEFADQSQKEKLLSDAFVKRVLQKAIDKAANFEVKGKWLEAYTNCYLWLPLIDPNNKAYSDYAEQLLDKAGIAVSFQNSPCETREQRYAGVEKEMFVRAIDALSLSYVSIIDYGQMAKSAIERCKLLAEVMALPSEGEPNKMQLKTAEVAAWSTALAALADKVGQSPTGFDKDKFIGVFEKVLTLNTTTVELPAAALIAQFAEAALFALDPYTVMVWPRQVQDFEKMMTNEFTGIGIEISKEKGLLTVASLLPDTPAYKYGLDAGDVIEAVDGVPTKDMTLVCAVRKITGPKGTKVTLTIRRSPAGGGSDQTALRPEEKPRDITIIRDKITVPTIRGWQRTEGGKWLYLIDERNKIGYVRLSSFSTQTASDLEEVLKQLEMGGLRGLILDLRFNSGGLLDSAVEVADKFLKKGLIVKTQPGSGFGRIPTYAVAREKDTHPDYPLAILINSGSASASEIVAGALADQMHKRAILVGERTHGKGSVQGITHYPGGGAQLKYTMAYYYLPSGQRVESQDVTKKQGGSDWGVGPNIEVELTSNELKKMIEVERDNEVLVQANHGTGREVKKHTIEETLTTDPQLAISVLVIKTKLIQANSVSVRSY
jgi:carboxyl-terminal processing protease